ncbi:uncharacterized protein LOC129226572 [Uloborus diversus]|uniref:uncharacterized protein LOC129226572 n=1 Tax=Uloborus diversus TaxID=327109 RepID=UPI0024095956|nr:uncharacterized protein LOC129226572 [Uloborus diversus]
MLLSWVIFILGFSYVLALPTCSDDEISACGNLGEKDWKGKQWPENAIELDKACSQVQGALECQIAVAERCSNTLLRMFLGYMKESQKLHKKLCSTFDPLRIKFLRTVPCLNSAIEQLYSHCKSLTSVQEAGGFCAYNFKVLSCVQSGLQSKCGDETMHVFNALYEPMIELDKIFCRKDDNLV